MNGEAPPAGALPFKTPSLAEATLRGLCPRCGARTLFDGFVRLAPRCRSCGLDLAGFNVGDGPAAFLILIVGTIVAVSAIVLDLSVGPPWWAHLVWVPIGLGLTLGGLRLGKAALLYQEVRHQAREGRLVE